MNFTPEIFRVVVVLTLRLVGLPDVTSTYAPRTIFYCPVIVNITVAQRAAGWAEWK
jgi:hypothetical protein